MEVVVVAVGRPRSPGLAEAIRTYERRAERYFRLRTVEVPAGGSGDEERDRAREGAAILEVAPDGLDLVALTREGGGMTSRGLARYLGELATYGLPGAAFAVGGAAGLAEDVLARARYRLSLSPMTLPHELARLVLVEQLYRAGTILRGEPYHRGG